MSNITVFVKARPGAAGIMVERRCRCGMCFDTVGRTVSVTEEQLALLQADPMLVVTDAPAPESELERVADKVSQIVTESPALEPIVEAETGSSAAESEAIKAEASAKADKNTAKADKTAAKADKEAG